VLEGHAPTSYLSAWPTSGGLADTNVRDNVQPPITANEYALCEELVLAHPPFQRACRDRGIDPADVRVDTWCVGYSGPDEEPSRRLVEV